MCMQRQEELAVGEARGQPVRSVHRQGRLADPGHTADGMDTHNPAVRRPGDQGLQQVRQFGLAASEIGVIAWQGPGSRGLEGYRCMATPGRQHIRGRPAAARCSDKQRAHRLSQA